jgi:HSP20 family molecular chaperone IbpA
MTGQQKDSSRIETKLTKYFDDFLNDVGLTRAHGGIKLRGAGGTDGKQSTWSPLIDIRENDKDYVVIVDVPGVSKEDLDVEFHDSLLVISGQNKQDPHTTGDTQEIGIDKDNQSTGPQHHQQSTGLQQPEPHQYHQDRKDKQPEYQQDRKDKQPEYQQDRKDKQPYRPSQPGEQEHYQQQQQPDERRYQSSDEQRYQQSDEQRYQQSDEQRYRQQPEQQYQQQHPPEEQPYYQNQHLSKFRQRTRGERVHIQERPYGYFSRSIQLPNNIKTDDDFYANLNNGVLKIRIPKSNDRPKKKITIS